jgi:hypothetical protein
VNASKCADECLLRHLLGIGPIVTKAPGQVDEPDLPPLNDPIEGIKVAGGDAPGVGRIVPVGSGTRHWILRRSPVLSGI